MCSLFVRLKSVSSERRLCSAGKIENVYLSSIAPIRFDETEVARFDLCIVPFDSDCDDRAFNRALKIVVALRLRLPILFCCAQAPLPKHLDWCKQRGLSVSNCADAFQMRNEIYEALQFKNADRFRIVPTAEDLEEEQREQLSKARKAAARSAPRFQQRVFSVLLLVAVVLALIWSSKGVKDSLFFCCCFLTECCIMQVSEVSGLPRAAVTLVASLLGAFAVSKSL